MYERILIPTDGSKLSAKAAQTAQQLAQLTDAQLIFLQVVPRYPISYFEGGISIPVAQVGQIERSGATRRRLWSTNSNARPKPKGSRPRP